MSNQTYSDKLRSPKWQKLRLEKMVEAEWRCEICGDEEEELNVHHIRYVKSLEPWDYSKSELQCLCRTCHTLCHANADKVLKYAKNKLHLPEHPRRIDVWRHLWEINWRDFEMLDDQGQAEYAALSKRLRTLYKEALDLRNRELSKIGSGFESRKGGE